MTKVLSLCCQYDLKSIALLFDPDSVADEATTIPTSERLSDRY